MVKTMGNGFGLWTRGISGGVLMGLANLVPGISGGTMLLATGVYRAFVEAVADISTLRWRARSWFILAVVGGSALLAIVLLAGPVKDLVTDHRWIMYSVFIGLTLGGVPLVWRLARPVHHSFWSGCGVGFLLMAALAFFPPGGAGGSSTALLAIAGAAGASAMILPGISGAYLLLVLGQYETILGAVDRAKGGWAGVKDASGVLVPVAIGVVAGVVLVSNLVRFLLARHEQPMLGFLFGLLFGSVLGIYPFQETVARGEPRAYFAPTGGQIAAALGLLGFGFAITVAIDKLGNGAGTEPSAVDSPA